ncbi:MAG TPA: 2'-5' RNA ligase family protein [Chthoniobacterales bacterium]|nr:2'-5' RNA ligase family protein [Chthoniobacterales bacterium]
MTAHEPKALVAYWLIPAEPARTFFASLIAELAARFDAPPFEPHVTIYAAGDGGENADEVLNQALDGTKPIRLSIRDIQYSDEFTKTVFVQFEPSRALSELCQALQHASALHDEYQLNPHLSLIYKKMTLSTKIDAVASVRLPFTEVLFDSVKAIVSPAQVESREDVEAWRAAAVQRLTG